MQGKAKVALGAVAVLLLILGGYLIFRPAKGWEVDNGRATEVGPSLLPGAQPPPGYKWVGLLDDKIADAAVLALSEEEAAYTSLKPDGLRFIIISIDIPADLPANQMLGAFVGQMIKDQEAQGWKRLSREQRVLTIRGQKRPALRLESRMPDGKTTLLEFATTFINQKKLVLLVINGPKDTFNKGLMQKFLDSLTPPDQAPAKAASQSGKKDDGKATKPGKAGKP